MASKTIVRPSHSQGISLLSIKDNNAQRLVRIFQKTTDFCFRMPPSVSLHICLTPLYAYLILDEIGFAIYPLQEKIMSRRIHAFRLLTLFLALLCLTSIGSAQKSDDSKQGNPKDTALPKVLIIGDSISIGYTKPTIELLQGTAHVERVKANCGDTKRGLQNLKRWLGKTDWDVIHFNWGLHDLKYMGPNGENLADPSAATSHRQVSPEDYRKNLETLVARLQKTGAKLIWRNTTPVPEGAKGRVKGDELVYNEIAKDVMARASVPTHDLYAFANARLDRIQKPADVHFSTEGSDILADDVVRVILEALQP